MKILFRAVDELIHIRFHPDDGLSRWIDGNLF